MAAFAAHGLLTDANGAPVQVVWTPAGGAATPINALRKKAFALALGEVDGNKPTLECAASDVAGIARDDAIAVGADSYVVVDVQPDGKGFVVLILQEQ